jgi:quercetin dioxygenase-like cupin family protein
MAGEHTLTPPLLSSSKGREIMRYAVVPPGQGPEYEWERDRILVKVPESMTDGRVTVVEDTLKPGWHLHRHYHRSMVEIFMIIEGELAFTFDDETVTATAGTTVVIPPQEWHEASSPKGARLFTVFTPGGFCLYLAELVALGDQLNDEAVVNALGEKYDIWLK